MAHRQERKIGKSRMDAAIDGMAVFGFSEERVRAKMIHLLKEYGGQDGYAFIEADAYKVLIDALLADQEEESKQVKTPSKGDSNGIEPSSSETPNNASLQAGEDNTIWRDIMVVESSISAPASQSTPARTRRPCYGWIDEDASDDEEMELVYLPPAPPGSFPPWDVRPDDI